MLDNTSLLLYMCREREDPSVCTPPGHIPFCPGICWSLNQSIDPFNSQPTRGEFSLSHPMAWRSCLSLYNSISAEKGYSTDCRYYQPATFFDVNEYPLTSFGLSTPDSTFPSHTKREKIFYVESPNPVWYPSEFFIFVVVTEQISFIFRPPWYVAVVLITSGSCERVIRPGVNSTRSCITLKRGLPFA
jgi:hypothetical protein